VHQKIMGVLLRHARQSAGRSQAELASSLHVPTSRYAQFEHGQREITLPELEVVAELCDVPLGFFFDHTASVEDDGSSAKVPVIPRLQRKLVGALLRQARQCAGKSQKEVAEAIHVAPRQLSEYESGEREVPADDLRALAAYLSIDPGQLRAGD